MFEANVLVGKGAQGKMILGSLAAPITFAVGFLVGRRKHDRIGMIFSIVAAAIVYVASVTFLTEPVMTFPFHALPLSTQILITAVGALWGFLGWFIGVNYEFLKKWKRVIMGKSPTVRSERSA